MRAIDGRTKIAGRQFGPIGSSSSIVLAARAYLDILWVVVALTICILLATRKFPSARDDVVYFSFFSSDIGRNFGNIRDFLFNEPLWLMFSSYMGEVFGVIPAIKLFIFASVAMYFLAMRRIGGGSWLLFVIFIVDFALCSQIYYNQLRQGFAISIFLLAFSFGVNPLLCALAASSVHTSAVALLPMCLFAQALPKIDQRWRLPLVVASAAVGAIALNLTVSATGGGDAFGRYATQYARSVQTSVTGYLVISLVYGTVLVLLRPVRGETGSGQVFWVYAVFMTLFALALMAAGREVAGRLLYYSNAFIAVRLMAGPHAVGDGRVSWSTLPRNHSRLRIIVLIIWLSYLMFFNIREGVKSADLYNTWAAKVSIGLLHIDPA